MSDSPHHGDHPTISDIDLIDLVAFDNETMSERQRAALRRRLMVEPDLRASLDRTRRLRAAVDDVPDAPEFAALRGPWLRNEATQRSLSAPRVGGDERVPASVVRDIQVESAPGTIDDEPRPEHHHRWLTMAAAAVLVVGMLGAIAAVVRSGDGGRLAIESAVQIADTVIDAPDADEPPVAVLAAAPDDVLAQASDVAVDARSARFDVTGDGAISFDGEVVGLSGEQSVGIAVSGDGAVQFTSPDGATADSRLRLDFVGVSGPENARPDLVVSESVVVDGRRYVSSDGIQFEEDSDGDVGILGSLMVQPDIVGRLDELATGTIDDLGVTSIDGVDARHLSFELRPEWIAGTGFPAGHIDVFVSSTELTYERLVLAFEGPVEIDNVPGAEMKLTFQLDVVERGGAVDISAPEAP